MRESRYRSLAGLSNTSPVTIGPCALKAFKTCGAYALDDCVTCVHNPTVLRAAAHTLQKRLRRESRRPTADEVALWIAYQQSRPVRDWAVHRYASQAQIHETMDRGSGLCACCEQALFECVVRTPRAAPGLRLCCKSCRAAGRSVKKSHP